MQEVPSPQVGLCIAHTAVTFGSSFVDSLFWVLLISCGLRLTGKLPDSLLALLIFCSISLKKVQVKPLIGSVGSHAHLHHRGSGGGGMQAQSNPSEISRRLEVGREELWGSDLGLFG